jgi:acetyl esterase/lipase
MAGMSRCLREAASIVASLSRSMPISQHCDVQAMPSSPHAKEPDMTRPPCLRAIAALIALAAALPAIAQSDPTQPAPRRFERLRHALSGDLDDGADSTRPAKLPDGVRLVPDISYGTDKAQRFDVYVSTRPPASLAPAPVIFFVHGGGWSRGDKANRQVIEPKVAHWVDQGYVVISTNYRMLPTPVAQQADDVAAAIAFAQSQAGLWGADPKRFVLMGHSAGAHLVALIGAGAPTATRPQPFRATVMLDSAALDVPVIMNHRHLGLYDRAFGADPQQWNAVSPLAQLTRGTAPMLAVCSSRRAESCPTSDRFAAKANDLGGQVRVLREDLSHGEINATLGAASDYTAQVDAFLRSVR